MRKEFKIVIAVNLLLAAISIIAFIGRGTEQVGGNAMAAGFGLGAFNVFAGLLLAILAAVAGGDEYDARRGWTIAKWIGLAMLSVGSVMLLCSFSFCTYQLFSGELVR